MATSRQEALVLIERFGAEMDDHVPGGLVGSVFTPPGTVWTASGCHTLAVNYLTDRPAGWVALLEDLREGVEKCKTVDCEMCEEN